MKLVRLFFFHFHKGSNSFDLDNLNGDSSHLSMNIVSEVVGLSHTLHSQNSIVFILERQFTIHIFAEFNVSLFILYMGGNNIFCCVNDERACKFVYY